MKIGVICETKIPVDNRTPLTPTQCAALKNDEKYKAQIEDVVVQHSDIRCYTDDEYTTSGVTVCDKLDDCDVLFGVKEIKVDTIIPNKRYFIFSHTFKKQEYNRGLLQAFVNKKCTIVDYELLSDTEGNRITGFSHWAGLVGAHNAMLTWGRRTNRFELPRMHTLKSFADACDIYKRTEMGGCRIVVTGDGRVSNGVAECLLKMGARQHTPIDYLNATKTEQHGKNGELLFTQLPADCMFERIDGKAFSADFFKDPSGYRSIIGPYLVNTDVFINAIYWESRCEPLFGRERMLKDFGVKVISDITCDIAPVASIPCTLHPATIADPIFGYDARTNAECAPHAEDCVDVTAVDNLPNELPREASTAFGDQLMKMVMPDLVGSQEIIKRATIAADGRLTDAYSYLQDFVDGK